MLNVGSVCNTSRLIVCSVLAVHVQRLCGWLFTYIYVCAWTQLLLLLCFLLPAQQAAAALLQSLRTPPGGRLECHFESLVQTSR